jgi:hypothetical protein
MEKLSGLVLDPADDHDGSVLRSIFPSVEDVPELVKSAEYLDSERRTQLPDELFALVLQDGEESLRKFACADAGNTVLSLLYFQKTAHKLPQEAQQVAATNLCQACEWYGLTPPSDLQKIAFGLGTALTLATGAGTIKQTAGQIKANLTNAKGSGGLVNPGVVSGPGTMG